MSCVERENDAQSMPLHGRDKPGVMDLFAVHSVLQDERVPKAKYAAFISKESKNANDAACPFIRLDSGESEAVLIDGPRCNYPMLIQHLRDYCDLMTVLPQSLDSLNRHCAIRMANWKRPEQDVRICKNPHDC